MVETRITIVCGFDLLYLTMWMRTGSLAVFGVHYLLHAAVHEWMDQGSGSRFRDFSGSVCYIYGVI